MIQLHNANCFDILPTIADESVDLILTDIPYCISKENNFKTMKDRTGRNGIDFGEWDKEFDIKRMTELVAKLKPSGSLFTFHSMEQLNTLRDILETKMCFKDLLVWKKTNPMPRNRERRYIRNIELASWFVMPKSKWTFNRQNATYDGCIFEYPSESGGGYKRYHPCQKNVKLLENIILRHSNEGDTILDPFMGSGSVGVACKELNRNFIGVELDENYFNIAKERINATVQ